MFEPYEIKLPYKQKIILEALQDEYATGAYTRELLDNCEAVKDFSMPQLTWALNELYKSSLVVKQKGVYKGKEYTKYTVSDFVAYGGVKIK